MTRGLSGCGNCSLVLAERDAVYAYIAEHSSPARAYAVLRRVAKAAAQLGVSPESGRRTDLEHQELVVSGLPYVISTIRVKLSCVRRWDSLRMPVEDRVESAGLSK